MSYVDGFVLPIPVKNMAAYRKMAKLAGKVWREHGALDYKECIADDVKSGKHTSFPQSVKLKKDEVVVFSFIVYKSKADRNRINKKVMGNMINQPMIGKMIANSSSRELQKRLRANCRLPENVPKRVAI